MHAYYLHYLPRQGVSQASLCERLAGLSVTKLTDACYAIRTQLTLERLEAFLRARLDWDEQACALFPAGKRGTVSY